ncbi:hypothetical protein F5B21DRAFT_493333 [Xylaria acuta]|nr:hypothetical protein F5B21DRAFT_493333 [Xylaria acuta]
MPTPGYHIVASECDKELLFSGMLSDVTVKCGDKTWSLHRAILVPRCPFFKTKALNNDILRIDDQEPKKVYWVIHFIYTGQLPGDLINLLKTYFNKRPFLMSTCIELFTLGKFFGLDGLCKRAEDVLTEHLIAEAAAVQSYVHNYSLGMEELQDTVDQFSPSFLEAVRTVYSAADSDDLQPLKTTLLLYLKLTRYVVLREELLGKTLRTDPGLAGFLTDILVATHFRPFMKEKEKMESQCSKCKEEAGVIVEFGDTITGNAQKGWCRKCRPLGQEGVMKLLGDDSPTYT